MQKIAGRIQKSQKLERGENSRLDNGHAMANPDRQAVGGISRSRFSDSSIA